MFKIRCDIIITKNRVYKSDDFNSSILLNFFGVSKIIGR